ncbi:MAG TPA: acyl-CoA dehydrogenase family protein [Streptosporangiaceae bacterium]|nr:acyl-CoA dehydrogenase family protein [Streptosporangiaceae bacterium]
MDFTLADSQQAVTALAAEILAGAVPDRGALGPEAPASTGPWKELARAGLLSLGPDGAGPDSASTDGLGLLDVTVLLTEIGRRAVPVPALPTLMTGALPLLRWGRPDLLPAVASGELILTAALRQHSPDTWTGVPYASQAQLVLVPSITGVALVNPHAEGVTLIPTPSSSGQPECTLRLDDAPIEAMLGGPDCAEDLYQLSVAGACAMIQGAVAGALALTRDHVATREQFGRPLAAFQAVSQQVADVYIASRTIHLATLAACWRLNEGLDAAADLAVAAYWCAEQAPRAVRICHHLHGGIGMDATYPLHRFSALVADLVRYLGGAEYRLACIST